MNKTQLLDKALRREELNLEEASWLYHNASLSELVFVANEIRKSLHPSNEVGWIIDRNVNITNVCISRCKFCNFHCTPKSDRAYITEIEEYFPKIEDLFEKGGEQLLMQGGLHPHLGIEYYENLFSVLKKEYPRLKLHALGPPEIAHISKIDKLNHKEVLIRLTEAGLTSLPGAGAEILSDRVRKLISPGKCNTETWLNVMREAHKLNLVSSATMMFGHTETIEERIQHLIYLREVQSEVPEANYGFVTFVPWPFQDENTNLREKFNIQNTSSGSDYIRLVAMSRIILTNIKNIQASWLTVGKEIGQMALHAGANDFGSIMLEENVVSSAGANNSFNAEGIQKAIQEAGFTPRLRNQAYEFVD